MSHFYGTVQGNRGLTSRGGSKSSGITTYAASWEGAIKATLRYNEETGKDEWSVELAPWLGRGRWRKIADGVFGE